MLGYEEPPISILPIYDYEVELPQGIPKLYRKQASFSRALMSVQVQHQRTGAATTPQAVSAVLTDS